MCHGDFGSIDLCDHFVNALADEEFVVADFANGTSLSRPASRLVNSRLWVGLCFLHTLTVIGAAAKCAEYHLFSFCEIVMAARALLGRLLLAVFDRTLSEEDGILVIVVVASPSHHKLATFANE